MRLFPLCLSLLELGPNLAVSLDVNSTELTSLTVLGLSCWTQIGTILGCPGPQLVDWRSWHISVCIII